VPAWLTVAFHPGPPLGVVPSGSGVTQPDRGNSLLVPHSRVLVALLLDVFVLVIAAFGSCTVVHVSDDHQHTTTYKFP
jgi:hypothetical protein